MIREVVTLSMSDIVWLLGALVLLSLGITLTLWGLKRRWSGAVLVALFLCLAALVPAALAVEIPPAFLYVAEIQTTGPNAGLNVGDWYTHNSTTGPGYHTFDIFVPCAFPGGQTITVTIFDPESRNSIGFPADQDEIIGGVEDNTTFTLTNPTGGVVATTTYTPDGGTDRQWVPFTTFIPNAQGGCGIYRLTITTSDNDENAWKLRVEPDNPDGLDGTGDEISLGNVQTTFQHNGFGCQIFHFLVPVMPSVILGNFDMDLNTPGMCDPYCTVVYTDSIGTVYDGTVSRGTEWSGGDTDYPPREDVIPNPEPGWWQAALCLPVHNQYLFDTGGLPYFYEKPPVPDMSVSKDDGTTIFVPGGMLTYTITYANTGPGAALDAVLTDTLPLSTVFFSCSGGLGCGEIPPGSGVVIFQLGTIVAGGSGSVTLTVRVDPSAPPGTITNTVELDYTDIVFSDYPPETYTDVDRYDENPAIEIAKTVYLGHDSGAGCPGSEIVTDTNGADVTYCFEVINTGGTYLGDITINDTDLGITDADMNLQVSMSDPYPPLAPGGSLVYYYEGTINGYLVNTAQTEGNPTDANGGDLSGLDNPTAAADATVDISLVDPAITKSGDPAVASPGEIVTFIMQVTNSGIADAHDVVVTDVIPDYLTIIGIPTTTKGTVQQPIVNNTVVVDIGTIAGDNSEVVIITIVTEVKAGTAPGTVVENQASLAFAEGGDRQSNVVRVEVPGESPAPEPSEPESSEPESSEPSPPPAAQAAPTPTPTVEVLAVARLPETGGFPGWLTVLLGVPIIIGAAGLLNLALLETRGRRGDGKGD